jgi:hypothetical protein
VFTERYAIEQRMREIREERRELQQEYYKLMDRLRELDDRDVHGYDVQTIMMKLGEAVSHLSQLVPSVPVEVAVEEFRKKINRESNYEEQEEQDEPTLETNLVKENVQKAVQESILNTKSTKKHADIRQIASQVRGILQEANEPVKTGDIEKKIYEEYGLKWANFSVVMKQVRDIDPRIQKSNKAGFHEFVPENVGASEETNTEFATALN